MALTLRTSPGPEGSKDKQALAGARGVPYVLVRAVDARGASSPALITVVRGRGEPGAVPQVPLGHVRRGHRPGPRHRAAARSARGRTDQPRLPVQRAARVRQDVQRPHPGPQPELREGPDPRPVRRVRLVPRARPERPGLHRRHRDRRGQPQRCRRRARPARAGVLRAGARPLQGLHHRRGAHGHDGGVQRAAQARRGAAGLPGVRVRHHRAGQGADDDPLAHPPLPVPADPAGHHARAPRVDLRAGGHHDRAGRAAARRARRRRIGA